MGNPYEVGRSYPGAVTLGTQRDTGAPCELSTSTYSWLFRDWRLGLEPSSQQRCSPASRCLLAASTEHRGLGTNGVWSCVHGSFKFAGVCAREGTRGGLESVRKSRFFLCREVQQRDGGVTQATGEGVT